MGFGFLSSFFNILLLSPEHGACNRISVDALFFPLPRVLTLDMFSLECMFAFFQMKEKRDFSDISVIIFCSSPH
jgi:hypothetical protein